jgi:hypothetical protein
MRPRSKYQAPDVWIVREQASFQTFEAAHQSIRTRSFERQPFRRSQSDSQLLLTPHRGKGISVYMSTKLYVGNLAFRTTSQELQDLFAQAGTVQSASVVEDRETGRSRGFAFVEMSTNAEAEAAIEQFNGKDLGGRALKVNEAKPRESRSGGGGGRNFGGGGGGGYRGGNSGNGNGGHREPRW